MRRGRASSAASIGSMVNEGGCSLDRGHRYGKNARCLPLRWIYQPLERRRAEGAGISTKSSSELSRNAAFFFLARASNTRGNLARIYRARWTAKLYGKFRSYETETRNEENGICGLNARTGNVASLEKRVKPVIEFANNCTLCVETCRDRYTLKRSFKRLLPEGLLLAYEPEDEQEPRNLDSVGCTWVLRRCSEKLTNILSPCRALTENEYTCP